MPGFTTHYLFGVKAYNNLPSNYLKHIISKYRWLYQLGLQGPDIFFYNIPILRHRDYRNVGSYMHENYVNLFFRNCLTEIARIRSRQQREEALSYYAGFLCHYAADSICHPYIYGRIQYETEGKRARFHGLHAELENDIDAILLYRFKRKKPSKFNQAATICLNGQEMQFISGFLSRCINATFYQITESNNFQVTEGMVRRSVYAVRFGGRLLSDPTGHKQSAVRFFEAALRRNPVASKKLITDSAPLSVRKALNIGCEEWSNPWDPSLVSTASFPELYRLTLKKCALIYEHLNDLITGDTPLENRDWEPFLSVLGNDSYHSGLDVGGDP